MSSIKWKNIDSSTIAGLIITSLPPISKPKMRTSTTEIDGLDGDIVENLGYKSYTKTISIGLSYDYDIDEVINYFNGQGKLVLSNEPDKYYNAQIIDNIDFEKLLRFKTADVSFHVQPYKYLLNETKQILTVTTETSLTVENQGYEKSKPIITIYGSGTIQISINNINVFSVTIDEDDEYITVDSMQEEAYCGATLKNRNMNGDFPLLDSGESVISWTGTVTKIEVEPKSRWL